MGIRSLELELQKTVNHALVLGIEPGSICTAPLPLLLRLCTLAHPTLSHPEAPRPFPAPHPPFHPAAARVVASATYKGLREARVTFNSVNPTLQQFTEKGV